MLRTIDLAVADASENRQSAYGKLHCFRFFVEMIG